MEAHTQPQHSHSDEKTPITATGAQDVSTAQEHSHTDGYTDAERRMLTDGYAPDYVARVAVWRREHDDMLARNAAQRATARERYTQDRARLTDGIRATRKNLSQAQEADLEAWREYGAHTPQERSQRAAVVRGYAEALADLEAQRRFLAPPSDNAPVFSYTPSGYAQRVQWTDGERAAHRSAQREALDALTAAWLADDTARALTLPEWVARCARRVKTSGAVPSIRSYAVASAFLGERERAKLCNNTHLERRTPDAIAVRYHDTDIVTFHAVHTADLTDVRERVTFDTGGYMTDATYRRMCEYAPSGVLLERYTVPARHIRRGADYPRDTYAVETHLETREWYAGRLADAEEQEADAMSTRVESPFMLQALLMGAGCKRASVERAVRREASALWTLTTPDGARIPFYDGVTLTLDGVRV